MLNCICLSLLNSSEEFNNCNKKKIKFEVEVFLCHFTVPCKIDFICEYYMNLYLSSIISPGGIEPVNLRTRKL